ncbi:MAG: UDP-N-acetylglucosamine diphosphorylase [Opitutales bacterium]|nr:UDP-N-acetylglucosamine diphosphorylase [Opitutales bacterium]
MNAKTLFDLPESLKIFGEFFDENAEPWLWLKNIKTALESVDFSGFETKKDIPSGVFVEGKVYIHPSVKLPAFASISGPAWIGAGTEVRPGAFIRGCVIIGENCVVGNSCEYKNCILMDNVQTPHYNYIGDSILGTGAHTGAGVICANLRLDNAPISVKTPEGLADTGMRKIGALFGEYAECGCNSVLQPGTILMKRSAVMPCMAFNGLLEEDTIAAERPQIRRVPRPPKFKKS